jgi:hypothetical protein
MTESTGRLDEGEEDSNRESMKSGKGTLGMSGARG